RLVERLGVQISRQARFTTFQRWFRWLEDRGGDEGHPMVSVLAALFSALTAQPADAERRADVVDRWQYGDAARPDDPYAAANAAQLRAILCRHGVEQMCADAEEAVRRYAAENIMSLAPALFQGIAHVLCGDLDGGDASFQEAISTGEKTDEPQALAMALSERSLVAMARGEWARAQLLAGQAHTVLREARIEESFSKP